MIKTVFLRVTVPMAFALVALGQAPPQAQADGFEVATIKVADPESTGRWIRMLSTDRFQAHNHSVRTLIAAAYDINPQTISGGPSWVESDRWEIVAKTPGAVRPSLNEQMSMLRKLLDERFQLGFHRTPKEFSIYALSVAKSGAKLKETSFSPDETPQGPPAPAFVLSPEVVRLPARYVSMAEFASLLQRSPLERPVVDRTNLPGRYDFDLEFAPDERLWGGIFHKPENTDRPDLFKAIEEQLGLKLEATRGAVQALVIDRIQRPSEN